MRTCKHATCTGDRCLAPSLTHQTPAPWRRDEAVSNQSGRSRPTDGGARDLNLADSRREAARILSMQPRRDTDSVARDVEQQDNMLRLMNARRRCHDRGKHAHCKGHPYDVTDPDGTDRTVYIRCRPERCPLCKSESLEAWDRSKYRLSRQADEFLRQNRHRRPVPKPQTNTDWADRALAILRAIDLLCE